MKDGSAVPIGPTCVRLCVHTGPGQSQAGI